VAGIKIGLGGFQRAEYSNMWTPICRNNELHKSNQEQYAQGKMRVAALGKKSSGLQQKIIEGRTS
jgi:hypothetical protein